METAQDTEVINAAFTALSGDARVDAAKYPIAMSFAHGVLVLEGEVPDIAAKKLASSLCSRVPSVKRIEDRTRVAPAERMGDGAIRDHVRDALLSEQSFEECSLVESLGDRKIESVRDLHAIAREKGEIQVSVQDGVVTLRGTVPSLAHVRLAVVLAWWVPGTRDVTSELRVAHPDAEGDDGELTDAVRLALEKDPFVDAGQIRILSHDDIVTLRGSVENETQARIAERDAWFVPGVRDVKNELTFVH